MNYVIFGASDKGVYIMDKLSPERVLCFCDNYKAGMTLRGKKVISFDELKKIYNEDKEIIIVVVSIEGRNAIYKQLHEAHMQRFFSLKPSDEEKKLELLPRYDLYRQRQVMSYADILAHYNIRKYNRIVIVGVNDYLPLLISEIAFQCGKWCIINILDLSEKYKEKHIMGIPVIDSLDELHENTDCIVVNIKRCETDLYDKLYSLRKEIIDIYDIAKFIPVYRHQELAKYKNIHKGERCFIIGTGPSLRMEDLNTLKRHNEICFGVNKIYKAYAKTSWRPDYLCVSDPLVISSMAEILCQPTREEIFITDDYHWTGNKQIEGTNYVHFFTEDYGKYEPNFSNDITNGVFWGFTVIYDLCLQIATYMGFEKMYLIGADSTSYGDVTDPRNHFIRDYHTHQDAELYQSLGHVSRWDKVMKAYRKAEKYSREHGFRIYNATRGGALEVFERVSFDALFD